MPSFSSGGGGADDGPGECRCRSRKADKSTSGSTISSPRRSRYEHFRQPFSARQVCNADLRNLARAQVRHSGQHSYRAACDRTSAVALVRAPSVPLHRAPMSPRSPGQVAFRTLQGVHDLGRALAGTSLNLRAIYLFPFPSPLARSRILPHCRIWQTTLGRDGRGQQRLIGRKEEKTGDKAGEKGGRHSARRMANAT